MRRQDDLKSIADFMGESVRDYDASWDTLMPVVKKVKLRANDVVRDPRFVGYIQNNFLTHEIAEMFLEADFEAVFNLVARFAKFYNDKTK